MMDFDWVISVTVALCLWTSLYFTSGFLMSSRIWEWHCRCITMLHAVVITCLSAWAAIVQGPWPFTDPAGPNTVLQHWICVITLGYFIFDLLWCLYFNTEGPIMLFHHVLSIFGNSMVLTRGINGCEMMATLFGTEITNPLLQSRWFLRQSPNYKGSRLSFAIDMAFLSVFTLMRICIGSVLLYDYLAHPRPDFLARSGAVAIYVVGWVFWISILRYSFTKYCSGSSCGGRQKIRGQKDNLDRDQMNDNVATPLLGNGCHKDGSECRDTVERKAGMEVNQNGLNHRTIRLGTVT